jgi:hypothetical protein
VGLEKSHAKNFGVLIKDKNFYLKLAFFNGCTNLLGV